MSAENNDSEYIKHIQREIILLKRKIAQLKFKNSTLFKSLNFINHFIYIIYIQFIISYIIDFNFQKISNSDIQFNVYTYPSEMIKLYTIKFKYNNYFFRVKINKELDKTIMYSDAIISKDLIFQIPIKLKLKHFNNHWFFINESLGILTICLIIVFIQSIAHIYKQNEHYYPLISLFSLSILSWIGIVSFSLYIHKIF